MDLLEDFSKLSLEDCDNDYKVRIKLKELSILLVKTSKEDSSIVDLSPVTTELKSQLTTKSQTCVDDFERKNINVLTFLKCIAEFQTLPCSNETPDLLWMKLIFPIFPEILSFLSTNVFEYYINPKDHPAKSSAAQHQYLALLHKGLKIALTIMKRGMTAMSHESLKESNFQQQLAKLTGDLCQLMSLESTNRNSSSCQEKFELSLDIRCNIGILLCYIARLSEGHDTSKLFKFYQRLLTNSKETQKNYIEEIVDIYAASDMNKICILFGILSSIEVLTNTNNQNEIVELFKQVSPEILNMELGTNETKNLGAVRVMDIWIDKLALENYIKVESLSKLVDILPSVELFSISHLTSHIDSVKWCCRNIIENLTKVYDRLENENNFKAIGFVQRFLENSLTRPDQVKWIAMSCIAQHSKRATVLLSLIPDLPEVLLCVPRIHRHPATAIYLSLMSYKFQTEKISDWQSTWISPLFATQLCIGTESNWDQKRTIISTILKASILKEEVKLKLLVPSVMSSIINFSSNENSCSESSLLAVEALKIATELKISECQPKESSDESESFRGMVSRSVIQQWCCNQSIQIRLAAFSLLVETNRTTQPFTIADLESIKITIKYSLVSQDPAFRQQFLSCFRKFLRRLRDSWKFLQRTKKPELNSADTLTAYRLFLLWTWNFFSKTEGLYPSASFSRRCQSLECLCELFLQFEANSLPNSCSNNPDNLANTFQQILGYQNDSCDNFKQLSWLNDSYEYNKQLALQVLEKINIPCFSDEETRDDIFNLSLNLLQSVRPPLSATGRYLMVLLIKKTQNKFNDKYSTWNVLQVIFERVKAIYDKINETSLTEVSAQTPLYGYFKCLRMIFENILVLYCPQDVKNYKEYLNKVIDIIYQINSLLLPVLGNPAPEGFIPELELPDSNPENGVVVRSVSAQMLLICSWRSMKECCLLLAEMCHHFPMEGEVEQYLQGLPLKGQITNEQKAAAAKLFKSTDYVLSYTQVESIGQHLLYLMKNLMHRGVFEQVYTGFRQLAMRLWKSSSSALNSLPEKWLQEAMDQDHISTKCFTRRSAGLPFIFQALLAGKANNDIFMNTWLSRLFITNASPTPEVTQLRIHSLNILRGLFRDATFCSAVMPIVPAGLRMAFCALKSSTWPEKNSGLMVLGAIIRRAFGPHLNLMSATTFFRKFPSMYDFLLNELEICTKAMTSEEIEHTQAEKDFTYYILLLLSAFTPSTVLEDGHFQLANFIPYVIRCGSSRDIQVRKLAAVALVPFITSTELKVQHIGKFIKELNGYNKLKTNTIHGTLLQTEAILNSLKLPQDNLASGDNTNAQSEMDLSNALADFEKFCQKSESIVKCPVIYEAMSQVWLAFFNQLKKNQCNNSNLTLSFKAIEAAYQQHFGEFGDDSDNARSQIVGLLTADEYIAEAKKHFYFHFQTENNHYELIYTLMKEGETIGGNEALITKLLQFLIQDKELQRFGENEEFGKFQVIKVMSLEIILERYCKIFKSCSDLEQNFLEFFAFVSPSVYTSCYNESYSENMKEILTFLHNRLMTIISTDSGTMSCKKFAFETLCKIYFYTQMPSLVDTTDWKIGKLISNLMVEWSSSIADDDLRSAVANSIPCAPLENCKNVKNLGVHQQCQIWSAIFTMSQDDEGDIRRKIIKKLKFEGCSSSSCDRKFLEDLVHVFFTSFVKNFPLEGLVTLIALLLRDDFIIKTDDADENTAEDDEEKLFDKSEMNIFAEPVLLCRIVCEYLNEHVNILEVFSSLCRKQMNADLCHHYEMLSSTKLPSGNKTLENIIVNESKLVPLSADTLNNDNVLLNCKKEITIEILRLIKGSGEREHSRVNIAEMLLNVLN